MIIKEIFLCFEYGECRISDSANVSFEAINGMGYLKKMVCVCVWEGGGGEFNVFSIRCFCIFLENDSFICVNMKFFSYNFLNSSNLFCLFIFIWFLIIFFIDFNGYYIVRTDPDRNIFSINFKSDSLCPVTASFGHLRLGQAHF